MRLAFVTTTALVLASCEAHEQTPSEDAEVVDTAEDPLAEAAADVAAERAAEAATEVAEVAPSPPLSLVPVFDTDAYCRKIGDTAGGSYQIERTCLDMENDALAAIQQRKVPDRVMNYCTRIGETAGGSFQIMNTCIDMEIEAM